MNQSRTPNADAECDARNRSMYKPELDGLRAIAIVSVIVNHLNDTWLPNGYLGVDIFFVISGFVITKSLAGRVNVTFFNFTAEFFVRRMKRLMPALAMSVALAALLICVVDQNPIFSLRTGISSIFGLSNFYLLKQASNYFGSEAELNIFTHTWSLGVEEQFYFLFPFIFWLSGISRLAAGQRNFLFIMGLLSGASLISFIYLYQAHQPVAYFLMPMRFWELGSGCLTFIISRNGSALSQVCERTSPMLLISMIACVMLLPKAYAVLATVSIVTLTVLLLAALRPGTSGFKFLTNRHAVFVGQISYSLYLYHWAILCLSRWTIGFHWWSIPIQLVVMLSLAVISYRYIETPLRSAKWGSTHQRSLGIGICFSLCSVAVLTFLLAGASSRIYAGTPSLAPAINEISTNIEPSAGATGARGTLLLVGDSHAWHLSKMAKNVAADLRMEYRIVSEAATPYPLVSFSTPVKGMTQAWTSSQATRMAENLVVELRRLSPTERNLLVLSSYYRFYFDTATGSRKFQFLTFYDDYGKEINQQQAFRKWLKDLEALATGAKNLDIIVFLSTPEMPEIYPISLCEKQWFRPSVPEKCRMSVRRVQIIKELENVNSSIAELASRQPNIYIFDPLPPLCPINETYCNSHDGQNRMYADEDHLTEYGAEKIKTEFEKFLLRNGLSSR